MKLVNRLYVEIEKGNKIRMWEINKDTVMKIQIYKIKPINKLKTHIVIEESNKIKI